MKYWVAHVRGPNFERLRRKGFVVLYPEVDDYVFLEAKPENRKLTVDQASLGVMFLRRNRKLVEVTQEELDQIQKKTTDLLGVGTEVLVIGGYCANLEGTITEEEDKQVRCTLKGYNREYDVWVDRLDVTRRELDKNTPHGMKKPRGEETWQPSF